jgi:DNA adenine methylase
MPEGPLTPFIKWPGGKRWAAARIANLIKPHLFGTYFEPFLGGGAVFFHMRPRRSLLADINEDLINTYRAVRNDPQGLARTLRRQSVTAETYYRIRTLEPVASMARAARFLYLNRTAFGGIYRLNLAGEFNVPYGGGDRTPEVLWKTDVLQAASKALRLARLKVGDFELIVDSAGTGDVVYCDPTYTVAHDNNGFIRYNERNFSWSDQQRLADAAFRAAGRGAVVIVTNAHHTAIKQLYRGARFETLSRVSTVTPRSKLRGLVKELLICIDSRPAPARPRSGAVHGNE